MRWGLFVFERMRMKTIISGLMLIGLALTCNAQPWHFNILWQREGQQERSHYGSQISSLGDQNEDGFADWAVAAYGGGRAGQPNENYVEFFHGGNPPSQEPYHAFRANPQIHWDLDSFFPAGDLNGDGFVDYVIEFRPVENYREVLNQIYFGGPNADTIPELTIRTSWDVFFSAIGDYNADGYDDLWAWDQRLNVNKIYYGGLAMDSIPDLNMPNMYLSYGDLNGDRATDFLIGYGSFFYGGFHPDTLPRYTWPSFIYSGADIVNDLNGDGKDELVLIPQTRDHLNIHFGRNEFMSQTPDFVLNSSLGFQCFSLGDINRDGYKDFAAQREQNQGLDIFLGHPWLNPNPAFSIGIRTNPLNLPATSWVAGLGDVNGDGIEDIGIGSTNNDFNGLRGKALIISGDSTYHVDVSPQRPEIIQDLRVNVYPNPFNAETTIQLDLPSYERKASLTIFNVLGQKVFEATLTNLLSQTFYPLDAHAFSSGIFFLHVQAGNFATSQKLVILK
jgi:hypothetical protein